MKNLAVGPMAFLLVMNWSLSAFAAPHPVNDQELLKITIHLLEDGEKKSTQVVTVPNAGSAATFHIQNNKKFVRNFIMPEQREGKKVLVRLHQCSGDVTNEQLGNLSSVDCKPEIMSRLNVEATLNEATMVETKGMDGQKQEYFIFVERAGPALDARAELAPEASTL